MANVTVTNNMARLYRAGGVLLVPGDNVVDAKEWAEVKDLPAVKALTERDPDLRVVPLEVTGEEKPEAKGKAAGTGDAK